MKKQWTNQNGRLTLCWFCFNPEPGEERKAIIRLPDDFYVFDFTILSRMSPSVFGFPRFFEYHIIDRPLFGDPENVLHDEGEARNSTLISALRGRNRCLLAAVKQKKRSLVELKAFWLERRVFSRQNIVYNYISFVIYCPPCLFFKKLFISFGGLR